MAPVGQDSTAGAGGFATPEIKGQVGDPMQPFPSAPSPAPPRPRGLSVPVAPAAPGSCLARKLSGRREWPASPTCPGRGGQQDEDGGHR
eukprot:5787462-Pyramimonas_sp.AAC.1